MIHNSLEMEEGNIKMDLRKIDSEDGKCDRRGSENFQIIKLAMLKLTILHLGVSKFST
jgi:hypothetical protein